MSSNYTVYKHTTPNGKVYFGITKTKLKHRWGKDGIGYKSQYFYRAIQKYGWENIEHTILYTELSEMQAKLLEISLIHHYKTNLPEYGYNITTGGEGGNGNHKPKTDEHKKAISESNIGKHSHSGELNPMFGKHHSDETKKKISESKKGKEAHNKGKTGFKQSEESIEKMRIKHLKPLIDDKGNLFESRLSCAEFYQHSPTWVATRIKDGRFKYVA